MQDYRALFLELVEHEGDGAEETSDVRDARARAT
jgi:hypothetical protein